MKLKPREGDSYLRAWSASWTSLGKSIVNDLCVDVKDAHVYVYCRIGDSRHLICTLAHDAPEEALAKATALIVSGQVGGFV